MSGVYARYPNGVTVHFIEFRRGNRGYTAVVDGRKLGFYHVRRLDTIHRSSYGEFGGGVHFGWITTQVFHPLRLSNFFKWLRVVKSWRKGDLLGTR